MTVLEEISGFVAEQLQGAGTPPGPDEPLIEGGLLTSLQTVELVLHIEERFNIEIDPELVDEVNFRTLRTVAHLVESRLTRS